jgi:hypothetical protein
MLTESESLADGTSDDRPGPGQKHSGSPGRAGPASLVMAGRSKNRS